MTNIWAFAVVFGLAPWCSELVLALRLLGVFPPRYIGRTMLYAVFTFPVVIKSVRLVMLVLYYRQFFQQTRHISMAFTALKAVNYRHSAYVKVEWFLQIFDNTYVCGRTRYIMHLMYCLSGTALRCSSINCTKLVPSRNLIWVANVFLWEKASQTRSLSTPLTDRATE